jgi:GNAT superfamily N-acetyltransferase
MKSSTAALAACLPSVRPLPAIVSTITRAPSEGGSRHRALAPAAQQAWRLRAGGRSLLVRPATSRDLEGVAGLHRRSSAGSLLERYRLGGRAPSVIAVAHLLRSPLAFVAVERSGAVIALAVAQGDAHHGPNSAHVGVLVEDAHQGLGIGREMLAQVSGAALVAGYDELIAYPGESVIPAAAFMAKTGSTRIVSDPEIAHLHTLIPSVAALGIGAVRERLAG